jgi:hypothetical protein
MKKFFALPDKTRRIAIAVLLLICMLSCLLSIFTQNYVFENGVYTSKKDVALYLYTYKHLPYNYVTKSQVSNSGRQPKDGKYIGGDVFYYRDAIKKHTQNQNLRECDISYPTNTTLRGTKRLVFAADCSEVFYTKDHYSTFVKVTKWKINATSNVFTIVFVVGCSFWFALVAYVFTNKGKQYKAVVATDLKHSFVIIGKTIENIDLKHVFATIGKTIENIFTKKR